MPDSAIPLILPPLLELPPADKLLVYLDLNHWIGLSQALVGHRQGASHIATLEACRAARASGRVIFVLSGTAYIEVQRIKHPDQRRRLAEVVEELADMWQWHSNWMRCSIPSRSARANCRRFPWSDAVCGTLLEFKADFRSWGLRAM